MSHTQRANNRINELEDRAYEACLGTIIKYSRGEAEGVQTRLMVAAAGAIAKQRQTRGAMAALQYQIARDTHKGLLPKFDD